MKKDSHGLGASFLLTAALLYGLYGVYSRLIGNNIGAFMTFVARAIVMLAVLFTYLKFFSNWKPVKKQDYKWFTVLIFGITAVCTGLLTIGGFKLLEAQKGSLIMLLEPVFGAIFGYLFFKEMFGSLFFIGAILIMISMVLPILKVKK